HHRPRLLPDARGGGGQHEVAARRAGRDGPGGRLLHAPPPVRLAGGVRAVDAHLGGDRAGGLQRVRRPGRGPRPAARVRPDPHRPWAAAPGPLPGRVARPPRGVGEAARADRRGGAAQLAPDRHRADRHDRVHRRLLRVRRAAGVEPVQARDALRRVPSDQQVPGGRSEVARALDACRPRGDQEGERVGPGPRGPARGDAVPLPDGVGAAAEGADRPRRRPHPVHRPVPVAEPVHGDPDHREALLDVRLRLAARSQDDVLPALPPGDPHRADHGVLPVLRRRLLPGEPRDLRGVPVNARTGEPPAEAAGTEAPRTEAPRTEAPRTEEPRTEGRGHGMLLDPGMDLTLRPMRYPGFYERFRAAIRNTWTVEGVDLASDLEDLRRLRPAELHLVNRLVAFFATGDSLVANNLVLNLYKHVNAPEARLYLSRQLFEEAVHVQFYLTLLDTYLPDQEERAKAFAAIEHIPSIRSKAEFCFRWIDSLGSLDELRTADDRRAFLLNLICFAACIEGLFFYGAFAYVYWLRSRGLLNGLASGTNWVFRDESMHMEFAF